MTNSIEFIDLKRQRDELQVRIKNAISKVIENTTFIGGLAVSELERNLETYTKAKHCITCANGTDALEIALNVIGTGPKDHVFVPAFTFASTAEAVVNNYGVPIFVDIDEETYNICVESLKANIKHAIETGLNLKAVIAVDLYGKPAPYKELRELCNEYGMELIADSAQSFGSSYLNKKTGSIADLTTTSFFPSKPLGCYGDGGAIFTNNDDYASKAASIKSHGKGLDKYDNVRIGRNSRLDTIQAAILLEKLPILDEEIERRSQIAKFYNNAFSERFSVPKFSDVTRDAWALYSLRANSNEQREKLRYHLAKSGIPAMIYYRNPLPETKAYESFPRLDIMRSINVAQTVISIPAHAYLTEEEIDKIVTVMNSV